VSVQFSVFIWEDRRDIPRRKLIREVLRFRARRSVARFEPRPAVQLLSLLSTLAVVVRFRRTVVLTSYVSKPRKTRLSAPLD